MQEKNYFHKYKRRSLKVVMDVIFIQTNKKPKFSNEVKHLSIEHHSYCN